MSKPGRIVVTLAAGVLAAIIGPHSGFIGFLLFVGIIGVLVLFFDRC